MNQDFEGGAESIAYRVISVQSVQHGTKLRVEAESVGFAGRYARITANSQVDYVSASAAEKAVLALNGTEILGREIVCNIAKPREPRLDF